MKAEIDWHRFAEDVRAVLACEDLSYAEACALHDGLNRGMLSRACNAQVLSAASYMAICAAFNLHPYTRFRLHGRPRLRSMKDVLKQAVTAPVPRETSGARP